MNILFFHTGNADGGAQASLKAHFNLLRKYYPNIRIILVYTYKTPNINALTKLAHKSYYFDYDVNKYPINGFLFRMFNWPFYRGLNSGFYQFILKYFYKREIGVLLKILKKNQINLIHTNVHPWRDKIAILSAIKLKMPVVCHIRLIKNVTYPLSFNLILEKLKSIRIIAISEAVKDSWFSNLKNLKYEIVFNPFELDFQRIKPDYSLIEKYSDRNNFNYCMVTRLVAKKGVIEAIENHQRIEETYNIHFFLIGDGELFNRIKEKITANQIKNIHIVGYIKDPLPIMKSMDLLVGYSYENYEAFGRTIVDAHSLGIPVISSPSGGIKELIQHEKTGVLVPYSATSKFYLEIVSLYKDRQKRINMISNQRRFFEANFDPEIYINRIVKIYNGI